LLSGWLLVGLFLDGWAHHELPQLETFFTPWHAVLYAGLGATAAWITLQAVRGYRSGRRGRAAIPSGYGLGLLGAGLFGVAGLSDLAWHTAFGIEEDLAALLSPPHLVLGFAAGLMVTSPIRAAWRSTPDEGKPPLRDFLPVLLSLTLTITVAAFFLAYLSVFQSPVAGAGAPGRTAGGLAEAMRGGEQVVGLSSVLITNTLLVAPLLAIVGRWRIPAGSVTVMFVTVAAFSSAEHSFDAGELVLAAAIGGVAGDALIGLLRPSRERPVAFRLVATAVPVALWGAYFGITAASYGLAWPPELWSGAVVLTALSGLGLSLLVLPPMRAAAAPALVSAAEPLQAATKAPAPREGRLLERVPPG